MRRRATRPPRSRPWASLAADYTEVAGYEPLDPGAAVDAFRQTLPSDPASVFLPDGDIGPLAKAILMLEANEGVLPRARYRLRYGMAEVALDPPGRTLPMSFVEVTRYNLGPAVRQELARTAGDRVAPAEHFGVGPHVSYRFAMRPIQGQAADVVGAGRAEIPDAFAEGMRCLGLPCLSLAVIGESTAEWSEMEPLALDFAPPYEAIRDGVLAPAAAVDLALRELGAAEMSGDRLVWTGFEPRESVGPMEPFAEAVIDVNLGQDVGVDAVFQDDHVMDHAIAAVWQRIASVSDGSRPLVFGAEAVEHRQGHN